MEKVLANLQLSADNVDELFEKVALDLGSFNLVENSYLDAITQREKEFPTGLKTMHLNIALPHTDPEHIVEPFIKIVRTDDDILMRQMGDNSEMTCRNFIFLGIKEPSNQVGVLAKIMELFSDEDFVKRFVEISDSSEMVKFMVDNM